jgi:hypothetical protein
MALRTGEVTGATPSAVNVAALLLERAEQAHDTGVLAAGEFLLLPPSSTTATQGCRRGARQPCGHRRHP